MLAMIFSSPPQRAQHSISTPNTRFSRRARSCTCRGVMAWSDPRQTPAASPERPSPKAVCASPMSPNRKGCPTTRSTASSPMRQGRCGSAPIEGSQASSTRGWHSRIPARSWIAVRRIQFRRSLPRPGRHPLFWRQQRLQRVHPATPGAERSTAERRTHRRAERQYACIGIARSASPRGSRLSRLGGDLPVRGPGFRESLQRALPLSIGRLRQRLDRCWCHPPGDLHPPRCGRLCVSRARSRRRQPLEREACRFETACRTTAVGHLVGEDDLCVRRVRSRVTGCPGAEPAGSAGSRLRLPPQAGGRRTDRGACGAKP